jgi:integrase
MRVALTDRFVAGSKVEDGVARAEFFDTKVKGLSLRVSPTSKGWFYHYTNPTDGKRARLTLGTAPAMGLATARGLALEAQAAVQVGQDPRALKAGAMTVSTLIESYLAKHVRPSLRSAKQIERRLRKNVVPLIGNVRLADLHRRDVNRVLDAVVGRDCPTEANLVYGDVRTMLRWAVARGDLDRNPIDGMKSPGASGSRDRVLSESEIRRLWNLLPTVFEASKDCQCIIKLCLITGQRVGEVAGMARSELDLSARLWKIPARRSKNKHEHQIPLSDLALNVIDDALVGADDSARLFELPAAVVSRFVGRAQTRFGITPPWVVHDLRRSVITNMAALSIAPIVLGHVANHRTTTRAGVTLAVYSQYTYDKEKREALELWAERLSAITLGVKSSVVKLARVGAPI